MPAGGGFGFGPFRLDLRAKRLLRNGAPVPLATTDVVLLGALVAAAGTVVAKDRLIEAAWPEATVGDNTLEKAILRLRRALDVDDPLSHIETCRRAGYRFIATVEKIDDEQSDADLAARLAPHRAMIDGRAALETLARAEIVRARSTFEQLLRHDAGDATFHVGLANACVLAFESTRADEHPDLASLTLGVMHAREACRLNPNYAEAWATLGFALERTGGSTEAVAALRLATTIDAHNWVHQLRLSFATWGKARLGAAQRAIVEAGECPLARALATTVYVARNAVGEARRELNAGLAEVRDASPSSSSFSIVALHWLDGLLLSSGGDDEGAMRAFENELALESRGHMYARECAANTWYAKGACQLRRGDDTAAQESFTHAIARVPRHAMSHVGLALLGGGRGRTVPPNLPETMDVTLARAALRVADEDATGAAAIVASALDAAPPGNAGWLIPVDPLLGVSRAPEAWHSVLSRLRRRAL